MTQISPAIDALIQLELPAARNGDQAAYGRIVLACQNTVTAVALAITRDVEASEDIAQEAFLNAWKHLEKLNSPDSFLPWLRQIARNLARDHLQRNSHRPLDGVHAELAMAVAADPGPQPMQRLLEDEREATAAELISALPEDTRETLLLYYREGQRSQQVADLLGITDAAVRKRLSRARQAIRDDLLKRFGEFASSSAPGAAFTGAVAVAVASVSSPASAATLAAGATGVGSTLIGKSLAGLLGIGGVLGGALAGGALAAHLTRRHLLAFAETLEERRAILGDYARYMAVTLPLTLASLLVVMLDGSAWHALAVLLLTEGASLWTLLRIRTRLLPLIARDRQRDPDGARRRYRAYDLSYGPTAIVVSGVVFVLGMCMLHAAMHPAAWAALLHGAFAGRAG